MFHQRQGRHPRLLGVASMLAKASLVSPSTLPSFFISTQSLAARRDDHESKLLRRQAGLPDGLFSNQKYQFFEGLRLKMLICFIPIWNILWTFGIFYDHLLQFVFIWYIISGFGIMYQEKSGNPDVKL
jgi:hypothetical protein